MPLPRAAGRAGFRRSGAGGIASVPPGEGSSATKGDGTARGDVCFVFCAEVFALSLARRRVSPALLAFKGEEM